MGPTMTSKPALYKLSVSRRADDTLVIRLAGSWKLENRLPSADDASLEYRCQTMNYELMFDN